MKNLVRELTDQLHFDSKIKYGHDFVTSLLPFFTREPERVKYTNGFDPIIGVIARNINEKNSEFVSRPFDLSKTEAATDLPDEVVNDLFSSQMYSGMRSSKLLQYLPLTDNRESKGEIRLGEFLIGLLKLKENQDFVNLFKEEEPENLYEKVIFESLQNGEQEKKKIIVTLPFMIQIILVSYSVMM